MSEIENSLAEISRGSATVAEFERKIDALALALLDCGELVDEDLTHQFTDGMYRRTLRLPAGTVAISMRHKTQNQFVITKGMILVAMQDGSVKELKAGDHGISEPGMRRVGIVIEDVEWSTFYPCENGETVEQIEARVYEDSLLPNGNSVREEWKLRLRKQLEVDNGWSNSGRSGGIGGCGSVRSEEAEAGGREGDQGPAAEGQGVDRVLGEAGRWPSQDAELEPDRVRAEV